MMGTLEILNRVTENLEVWGLLVNSYPENTNERSLCMIAAEDFRSIKAEIEASLDEMADGMLKQERDSKE